MINRDVACILFVNERNEILLQKKDLEFKRFPGMWCFFGGGFEQGEDALQALNREVKEELGLKLNDVELFKVHDYNDLDRKGRMHVFTARFNNKLSDICLNEGAGFAFFGKDEIVSLKMIPHDMKILQEFIMSKMND